MTIDPDGWLAALNAATDRDVSGTAAKAIVRAYLASRSSAIAEEPVATITELGEVMVPSPTEFKAMFDALPEVPHGGIKSIEVYASPQPHTGRPSIDVDAMVTELNRRLAMDSENVVHRADVRAALNAALTVEPEAGWQDIKTAPRDGTAFLATSEINGTTQVIGYDPGDVDTEPHWSDVGCKIATPTTWFNLHYFTHWMPLPAARIRSALAP
jgi:hypothetical protein